MVKILYCMGQHLTEEYQTIFPITLQPYNHFYNHFHTYVCLGIVTSRIVKVGTGRAQAQPIFSNAQPTSLYHYTLIEQSNTLLKQSCMYLY